MKKLIMVSVMLMSSLVQAKDVADTSNNSENLKNGDDSSVSIANVHQINLDTTEIDGGGNWLNKRIWYERAQSTFDEIRALVSAVGDLRIQFSNEVNAMGQKIDSFWETVDFTKNELDDKFKEILASLETEQKLLGDLSEEERNLQKSIKQELTVVDQIGKDIKSIHDIDKKIDQTLMQAFKTIDECRDYETKSWDTFKAIGKELDDKKSRNLYYQMNNYKQNIDQKSSYLKSTLLPYLHNVLVAKVESSISKVNESIKKLKAKGVDLEKIMSKTQEDDVSHLKAREKASAEIAVRKAVEKEQEKAKEAAEEAAKALEEAEKNSFSNVMHTYYESTVGKVVGYVYKGYIAVIIDSIKSYSYPVAIYFYNTIIAAKEYVHELVASIIIHFGGKSAIKAVVKEKIEQKIENVENPLEEVKEKIAEKIEEKKEESQKVDAKSDVVAPVVPSKEPEPQDPEESTKVASDDSSNGIAIPSEVKSEDDGSVVVQSMNNNDNEKQSNLNNFYQVFKTILDFFGTIFVSVYNCILQLLKLLFTFSSYLMSMN